MYELSSRIKAMYAGKKSKGASCNYYRVEDNIESIGKAHEWAIHVLAEQGAPALEFSALRPGGAPLSTGGTASGSVSFMRPFDAIIANMRRTEKKNGAGLLILDWRHNRSELLKFLGEKFDAAFKAVLTPNIADKEEVEEFLADKELLSALAWAYEQNEVFLCKRPANKELGINLCTEIELPHKGYCMLAAINLANTPLTKESFAQTFVECAEEMLEHKRRCDWLMSNHAVLACNSELNNQVGIGVFGLASVLGREGITYEELANSLTEGIEGKELGTSKEDRIAGAIIAGYREATKVLRGKVRAAFCVQPTVSTAHRCVDSDGYITSPELQPVIGLKHGEGVNTIIKSSVKGDKLVTYHPRTWTVYEVSYESYRKLSNVWQKLLNATGLGHRHSHCYYGDKFTTEELVRWYKDDDAKEIKSLYYRLKLPNVESLRKDQLWQSTEGVVKEEVLEELMRELKCNSELACDCAM